MKHTFGFFGKHRENIKNKLILKIGDIIFPFHRFIDTESWQYKNWDNIKKWQRIYRKISWQLYYKWWNKWWGFY